MEKGLRDHFSRDIHKAKQYTRPKSTNLNMSSSVREFSFISHLNLDKNPAPCVLVQKQQARMEIVFAKSPCEARITITGRRQISAV